jgi:hypothetical protein
MNLLELRKKFLAVLLLSFMALGMTACSSSDDPVSDDAASERDVPCDLNPSQEGCKEELLNQ